MSSFATLTIKYSYSLNEDFLVRPFVGLGVSNIVGSSTAWGIGSGVGSRIGFLPRFFVWNILLLQLLRIFSLALRNNSKLFKKYLS